MSGKALLRNGNYYLFTKGYYSWGATIPSNSGNNSYTLVNWPNYILDDGQIGRLVYTSNGDVDIHFKKSGIITLYLDDTHNIIVNNITGGGIVSFTISGVKVTFQGMKDCHYIITGQPHPPVFGIPSPADGSTGNPLSFSWNIPINDPEGNKFTWTIQCSNGQTYYCYGCNKWNKITISFWSCLFNYL